MGRRKEERIAIKLPVRVWGMNKAGRPFNCVVHTINISPSGALLGGFNELMKEGEVVGMQHGEAKVRCRVVTVTRIGNSAEVHVGVESLELQKRIWNLKTQELLGSPDMAAPPSSQDLRGRRQELRHSVSLAVHISTNNGREIGLARVSDISPGGCYVETFSPLPLQTTLELQIEIAGRTFSLQGTVLACHPGAGMGVRFGKASLDDAKRIVALVKDPTRAAAPTAEIMTSAEDSRQMTQRLQVTRAKLDELQHAITSNSSDPAVLRELLVLLGDVASATTEIKRWIEQRLAEE